MAVFEAAHIINFNSEFPPTFEGIFWIECVPGHIGLEIYLLTPIKTMFGLVVLFEE